MKNTQKKLKAKHFRYLTKEIIKNPMKYLEDFFERYIHFGPWLNEVRLLVISSCYPEILSRKYYVDGSFLCKKLIQQVEMAYVIFVQSGVQKQENESFRFFNCRRDYFNYTNNKLEDPYYQLSLFFSYMSLADWYKTLDNFWIYMAMDENDDNDRFGDRIIVIQELLLLLANALHSIYENKGMETPIPAHCYVNREEEEKINE